LLVWLIAKHPDLALHNPDKLSGLKYGPHDKYTVGAKEIEAIKQAHGENRQRWLAFAREERIGDQNVADYLQKRELGLKR